MKDKLSNGLLRVASYLQQNKYMNAIKNSFTALLPIIITGAFSTLILNVVLSTTTQGISLAKLPGMAWLENLSPWFEAANYATMNFFAIGLVVLIGIELGKQNGRDEITVPVVALSSYISLTKTFLEVETEAGEMLTVSNVLPREFTNAQGLFLAMFAAILSVEIYSKIVNSGKLEITMPESVPPNVSKSFNVLFPSVFTVLIIAGLGFVFELITGLTIFEAITVFIQTPLQGILTGLPGYLVMFFFTTLLWTMGIHGTQVLGPIYSATMLLALSENAEAALANEVAPNILNSSFINIFTIPTGAGITGGLIIALLLFSNKDDEKTIAKLSIMPGIFNINETMTFGLPIVLNPIYAIPFMLAPMVSATIGYTLTKIGFATPMLYNIPWTTPPLLAPFLATGGHIGTVITQAIALASSVLVYLPFVLIANKQETNEEL